MSGFYIQQHVPKLSSMQTFSQMRLNKQEDFLRISNENKEAFKVLLTLLATYKQPLASINKILRFKEGSRLCTVVKSEIYIYNLMRIFFVHYIHQILDTFLVIFTTVSNEIFMKLLMQYPQMKETGCITKILSMYLLVARKSRV